MGRVGQAGVMSQAVVILHATAFRTPSGSPYRFVASSIMVTAFIFSKGRGSSASREAILLSSRLMWSVQVERNPLEKSYRLEKSEIHTETPVNRSRRPGDPHSAILHPSRFSSHPPHNDKASMSALALIRLSSYSASGSESQVMPPPTCRYALPFLISIVPDSDIEVHGPVETKIPDGAGIDPPLGWLQLVDDLHGPNLRRTRDRPTGEGCLDAINKVAFRANFGGNRCNEVMEGRVGLKGKKLGGPGRYRFWRCGQDRSVQGRRS